jgi:hypothetical protein
MRSSRLLTRSETPDGVSSDSDANVDVDDVGGLPRSFPRRAFDLGRRHPDKTKTMLSTFRFPGRCFAAAAPKLRIQAIRAVHLGLNRGDGRPLAFDDVEIVRV